MPERAQTENPQPLTPKEKGVLEFLQMYIERHGLSPSFQEIKDHFGFASYNSVQRYLKQLERKEYIHVPGGNRKRAISLLQSASAVQENAQLMAHSQSQHPSGSTAYSSSHSPGRGAPAASFTEPLSLPLLGQVAAGQPIERLTDNEFIDVPASFVRNATKSYALQVQGDSMIEDGIHNGDVILVQEQSHASQGEITVALIDGEATVKRFYHHRQEGKIELRPSNPSMKPMWYDADQVEIRGIVVGLLRRYF